MRDIIHITIKEVLERLSLPHERVDTTDAGLLDNVTFEIVTDNPGMFIGKDGRHLHALTTIVRKIVRAKAHTTDAKEVKKMDFFIDVDGYKQEKIESVQRIAYTMASRAKRYDRDVELEPMNAYKRMIVHKTLEDEDGVTTESTGSGSNRRVVVYSV